MTKLDEKMRELLILVLANGGATVNSDLSQFKPKKGFQVAINGYEKAIQPTAESLKEYFIKIKYDFNKLEDEIFFGFWLDKQDGILYADLSMFIENEQKAVRFGLQEGQKAIWDWSSFDEIRL